MTLPKVAGSKWRVLARISDWNTHGEDTSTPERDNSTTPKRCSDGGRDACAWPRTGEKTNRGPVFRGNEGELRERFVRIEHSFLEASLRQPEWTKECHRRTQSGKKYKDPQLQHKLKKCNHHIIEASLNVQLRVRWCWFKTLPVGILAQVASNICLAFRFSGGLTAVLSLITLNAFVLLGRQRTTNHG